MIQRCSTPFREKNSPKEILKPPGKLNRLGSLAAESTSGTSLQAQTPLYIVQVFIFWVVRQQNNGGVQTTQRGVQTTQNFFKPHKHWVFEG